jgi:hypothetical protein
VRSRLGYLFGGFLIAFAFAVAGLALSTAISTMEGMQRVRMPGTAHVLLPAGPSTLYVESERDFAVTCGAPGLELHVPTSRVRYSLAGYRGHNAYDVDLPLGGSFELVCRGDEPFVIAIGSGVGAWIVIAVLAVIPLLGGIALVVVTFLRRRRATSARSSRADTARSRSGDSSP